MKKADKGAGVKLKKKSKCSKEDLKNVINKRQCKHCIEKSGTIRATTPPNTSPQANTNTVTEEKLVNGLIPNGGLGHDSTDTNKNAAHTLDTNKVPHNFHYYYSRYCCKQQGPDHQEHAKRRLLEFLQVAGLPIKTNQPMLLWKVCRKGPPNRQQQQKTIVQMKKKKFLFTLQLHPQSGPQKMTRFFPC